MGNDASIFKDELYEKVSNQLQETDQKYAAKITGMLLEMEAPALETLVASEDLLRSAVDTALQVYLRTLEDDKNGSLSHKIDCDTVSECDTSLKRKQDDSLADLLYEKVEKVYPENAAKVTGILLDQDVVNIETLLNDDQTLQHCIQKAYLSLNTAS